MDITCTFSYTSVSSSLTVPPSLGYNSSEEGSKELSGTCICPLVSCHGLDRLLHSLRIPSSVSCPTRMPTCEPSRGRDDDESILKDDYHEGVVVPPELKLQ